LFTRARRVLSISSRFNEVAILSLDKEHSDPVLERAERETSNMATWVIVMMTLITTITERRKKAIRHV
jgi:hypothetical protein